MDSSFVIRFNHDILGMMLAHGHSNLQDEVCALGLGHKNGQIWDMTKFCPIDNVVKDSDFEGIRKQMNVNPNTDYIPHPEQFVSTMMLTKHYNVDADFDLVVIFHTHPHNHPRPSFTDILGAGYEAVYIIYSPLYREMSFNYQDGINQGFNNANVELI